VEKAIKDLKMNESAGADGITNEQIKFGGGRLARELTKLYNEILKEKTIPAARKQSDIIILHKKEGRHKIGNYRPITITSTIAKVFSKVRIASRLKNVLDFQQPKEQAGFRRGFSRIDHLHVVNQLTEKSAKYKQGNKLGICRLYESF